MTQSWRELLFDIKQRGLEICPGLAVGDGGINLAGQWALGLAGQRTLAHSLAGCAGLSRSD